MPAPGTGFDGPVISGPRRNALGAQPANAGRSVLTQSVTIAQNGTNAVSATLNVPKHSKLIDIIADVTTAFDSVTSATLTVGNVAAGTQYAGGVDAKTAGRVRPTFTAAQLTAMLDTGTNEAVVATLTPVGATAAGSVTVTYVYEQTPAWMTP